MQNRLSNLAALASAALLAATVSPNAALAESQACPRPDISYETVINVMAATFLDEDRVTGENAHVAIGTTMMLRAERLMRKREGLSREQAVVAIILADRQFSGWNFATEQKPSVSRERLIAASEGRPTGNADFDAEMPAARAVAKEVFAGKRAPGALAHAEHFYNPALAKPSWRLEGEVVGKVGEHLFLTGVAGPGYPKCLTLTWTKTAE